MAVSMFWSTPVLIGGTTRSFNAVDAGRRPRHAASGRRSNTATASLVFAALTTSQPFVSAACLAQSAPTKVANLSQTAPEREHRYVTIVIGGDLGLGGSRQRVHPAGARKHGRLLPWTEMTKDIAPLISGDINFANLETVVTDKNSLAPRHKKFNFRSHPDGVRHLVELGFNVFSTANNHVIDYGSRGMLDTLNHLAKMRSAGLLGAPGIGIGRENAGKPSRLDVDGADILVSALGIGGIAPSRSGPGILGYRSREDFNDVVSWLAEREADYKMLSVHYGAELNIQPAVRDIQKLRDHAIREAGIDLVIGHHAHVAAGIQELDGRLIFFGLGNLLHPGMQDMSRFGSCRDYGLVAKLHVAAVKGQRLRAHAIEVWPVQDMHIATKVMKPAKARKRISVLNTLANRLDDAKAGAQGVRFAARADGSGLACLDGASEMSGKIGALCRNWAAPTAAQLRSANVSCRNSVQTIAKSRKRYRQHSARRAVGANRRSKRRTTSDILANILAY